MDLADEAAVLQQRLNEGALASSRRVVAPTAGESADECIECGELINSRRQLAVPGCQLCTRCAQRFEQEQDCGC